MDVTRSWFAVVISLTVAVSGWSGAVWCVSADHASLEWAGEGCCDGAAAPAAPVAGVHAADDSCGPCLDVALVAASSVPPVGPALAVSATAPTLDDGPTVVATTSSCRSGRSLRVLDGTCLRL